MQDPKQFCDLDIEQTVIGIFLTYPEKINETFLAADWFFNGTFRRFYLKILEMNDAAKTIDLLTVTHELRNNPEGLPENWVAEITDTIKLVMIAAALPRYISILSAMSRRRKAIRLSEKIKKAVAEGEDVRQELQDLAAQFDEEDCKPQFSMKESLMEALDRYENLSLGYREKGFKTGIEKLDIETGGVFPKDLVIISAESSGGKSALALQIALNAAIDCPEKKAVFYSIEMSVDECVDRANSQTGEVNLTSLRTGWPRLQPRDYDGLVEAQGKLSAANIIFRDDLSNIHEIRADARNLRKKNELSVVVVDYIQLCESTGDNREQSVSEVTRQLKVMASELDCVVISPSQLNDDGKLRESRAIGHHANTLLNIKHSDAGAEITIVKQRNGPRYISVPVTFKGKFVRFYNAEK